MSRQVPAAPARIHVQSLLDQGMSQAAICRAAKVTSAYLSALLYGQYAPGRPPQLTTDAKTADRLLAVEYTPSSKRSQLCSPDGRFTPLGYRVGRCDDCGQVAPVRSREGVTMLMGHPRPAGEGQELGELPAPAVAPAPSHPDCGTPRGRERHHRENTEPCEPCKTARRAWEQGYDAGMTKARRNAGPAVPSPLVAEAVKAMRAVLYRRPYPQLRELARRVVGIAADVEFAVDDVASASDREAA